MSTLVLSARRLGAGVQARAFAWTARPLFWVVAIAIFFSWPIVRTLQIRLPPPLPVLSQLPAFTLTDQENQPFGSEQLKGRVWIADFIFTRCPTICPVLTGRMGELQHRTRNLGDAFRLVSFTVDPEFDTPSVLAAYAKSHRVSPRRWSFVTGAPEDVKRAVVDGLKTSMGKEAPDGDLASIFHGTHLVLVDQKLRIRGYYDTDQPGTLDTVLRDAGMLVNRGY